MTRDEALGLAQAILQSGQAVHPRFKQRLQDAIGDLSDEENEMLRSYRLAGEACRERNARDVERLANKIRARTPEGR